MAFVASRHAEQSSGLTLLSEGFAKSIGRTVIDLLRLSLPVMGSRLGLITVALMDTIMLGRHGTDQLAYFAVAFAPVSVLMSVGMGLMIGTLVLTSQAMGAGKAEECGAILRRSIPYALGLGLFLAIPCLGGEAFLYLTGQQHEIAVGGGAVMAIFSLQLPPTLLVFACLFFFEGIHQPGRGTLALMLGNIVHFLCNFLLIGGVGDIPALGAEGAAWAAVAERWVMAIFLLAAIWWHPQRHTFGIRNRMSNLWQSGREQRRLGFAAGASQAAESGAFAVLALAAGTFGASAVAGWSILFNIIELVFMMSIGIGAATSIKVGMAYGRKDLCGQRFAGWSGLGINTLLMLGFGVAITLFAGPIVSFYTDDAQLVATALPLLSLIALLLFSDGGQGVMNQAVRGTGDAWMPTAIQFLGFNAILLPAVYVLAFVYERGVQGLAEAVWLATASAMAAQCFRFYVLTRNKTKRIRNHSLSMKDFLAHMPEAEPALVSAS